jgi:hypothetical protein
VPRRKVKGAARRRLAGLSASVRRRRLALRPQVLEESFAVLFGTGDTIARGSVNIPSFRACASEPSLRCFKGFEIWFADDSGGLVIADLSMVARNDRELAPVASSLADTRDARMSKHMDSERITHCTRHRRIVAKAYRSGLSPLGLEQPHEGAWDSELGLLLPFEDELPRLQSIRIALDISSEPREFG